MIMNARFVKIDLKIRQRGQQWECQKEIGLISKTTTLHLHHTFLYIFFAITTWLWNKNAWFQFYGGHKQAKNVISVLFLNLDMVLRNSTPGEFTYIWQSKWMGIIRWRLKAGKFTFFSNFLALLPSSDFKVPSCHTLSLSNRMLKPSSTK